MTQERYDLSHLGATQEPESSYDLSHLGAVPEDSDQQFNPGFFEKLAPNVLAGLANLGHSVLNAPSNVANFAASKGLIKPETAQAIPRQENYDYASMLNLPNTPSDQLVQSLVKNSPSMLMPELKGAGFIPGALSRVLGQGAWGAATNENPEKGAEEFGGMQAALEGLTGAIGKPIGLMAEAINPMKYAGTIAEKIRNLAQSGYDKAQPYYDKAKEYFADNVTFSPKKYLGFQRNDLQYFKAPTKKAYNDFIADPTLENLHNFQSKMGAQPELGGWRDEVKGKIASFLSRDKEALTDYKKGSDIMRDEYYPYVSNDTLANIAEHKRPITQHNPVELAKALKESSLVEQSQKSANDINHPLIDIAKQIQNKMNRAKIYQYAMPAAAGAIAGNIIHPGLGTLGGSLAGAVFGKYWEPQLLQLAQNPSLLKGAGAIQQFLQGAGRQAVGYNMYNQ